MEVGCRVLLGATLWLCTLVFPAFLIFSIQYVCLCVNGAQNRVVHSDRSGLEQAHINSKIGIHGPPYSSVVRAGRPVAKLQLQQTPAIPLHVSIHSWHSWKGISTAVFSAGNKLIVNMFSPLASRIHSLCLINCMIRTYLNQTLTYEMVISLKQWTEGIRRVLLYVFEWNLFSDSPRPFGHLALTCVNREREYIIEAGAFA